MLLKTSSLEAEPEAGISAPTICWGKGCSWKKPMSSSG